MAASSNSPIQQEIEKSEAERCETLGDYVQGRDAVIFAYLLLSMQAQMLILVAKLP